jgi:transcriptional regulator with XRE-family HTH domain
MNQARRARESLKLTEEEFALLLGVPESAVIREELREGDSPTIEDRLYMLILIDKLHIVNLLLEDLFKSPNPTDQERLNALAVKLRGLQVV